MGLDRQYPNPLELRVPGWRGGVLTAAPVILVAAVLLCNLPPLRGAPELATSRPPPQTTEPRPRPLPTVRQSTPLPTMVAEIERHEPKVLVSQGFVLTSSGLKYINLQWGTGRAAASGDAVKVHYTASLKDGRRIEGSRNGAPFYFVLGSGSVIRGFEEGVLGMRVGGRRRVTIPPALAYGDRAVGGLIPPNAELTFEIDLISLRDAPGR